MVFRAFLEQKRSRPGRGRAHLGSFGLHLAALLGLGWSARELPPHMTGPALAPVLPVSLRLSLPHAGERTAAAPAHGVVEPAAARPRMVAATARRLPARVRRLHPVRRRVPALVRPVPIAAALESPAPAALPVAVANLDAPDGPAAGTAEPAPAQWGTAGALDDDTGNGHGRGRRPELFARVIGNVEADWPRKSNLPFVSHKEATTLRTEDYFPRLPAALWPERDPYVVVIQLCVTEEGRVSEAALLSRASARLDPVVLAAVRSWRYRPRLEGGKPSPFCHGVVIKYERHY